jgi:Flp pilus assembly protein TadD
MENEPTSLPLPSAPYRGIEPFRFVDKPIFSARPDEVRKLVRLITIYRGIFFYGESGAGKSSLINAGLIPALLDEGFAPERVRVQPIAGHELVVERIALTDEGTPPFLPSRFAASADKKTPEPARLVLSVEEFVRYIGKAPMAQRPDGVATSGVVPVLFFDQFEELITLFEEAPDSREKFNQAREIQGRIVEMLLGFLGDPNLSIKLVLSFREDYLAKVSRRLAAAPQLGEQAFRLSFPPETALRNIIRGPFESKSIPPGHFTRRLSEPAFDALESSFKELSDTGTINLTEVQIACLALWENEEEEKAFLKESDHREAVRRLFGNYLDRALNRLDQKFRKPAITALTFLVTSSGTRNIVSEDDLLGNIVRDDQLTRSDAREVLKALSRTTRLVFRQTRGDSAFYEISSEFLIPWITEKRQARERDAQLEKQREDHERQQRELTQTQALLNEQRKRADDQAKAAKLQRRLTWAMVLISVVALVAAGLSWFLRNAAVEAKRTAIHLKNKAEAEALRARKQNFEDKQRIESMARRLADLSHPQEALYWHTVRAEALSDLGMHEQAIKGYGLILQLDPENLRAKFARGYEHYTQREAEEALQDTEAYLQKVPNDWVAHQNQGIFLGALGRYDEAEKAIRDSIREFQFMGGEFGENEVAPDIQDATGHTTLRGSEKTYQTANYYELANLKAYAGSKEFDAVLTAADKQPNSAEAALIALDWAWPQMDKRNEDYGALVAQGALWERAKFNDWAKKYYLDFERIHKQTKDKRYEGLARWAANRLATLKSSAKTKTEEPGVEILELEAEERLAKGKMGEALERINRAIRMAPDDVTLYLSRAGISYRNGEYRECKWDCDRILSKAPNTPNAYVFRALANKKLVDEKKINASPEIIEVDLRKALEHNPDDGTAMELLSDALYERAEKEGFETSDRKFLDEALQLLERSPSAGNLAFEEMPYIYYKRAQVRCARGDFEQARASLETAIAMKDDDFDFYDLLATIERGIYGEAGEALVMKDLCEGYLRPADKQLRLGRESEALGLYWVGIERLARLRKSKNECDLDDAIANMLSKISSVIERNASRAKVSEFWKTAIESGRWNQVRDLLENEELRFSPAKNGKEEGGSGF